MKLSRIAAIAASLILGLGSVSCTKMQPTEISNDQRPFKATVTVTVKFTGAPVYAGTPVLLTITDKEFNKTYKVTRTTGQGGILTFTDGCGTQGMSITAECQYVLSPKSYYGTGSANLTSTNGFSGTIDINMN